MADECTIPRIMALICDRYAATHLKPATELYPACWEFAVKDGSDEWHFAMNGHNQERLGGPHNGMRVEIPPCTCGVFYNGWLIGFVDPHGGTVLADAEQAIVEVLSRARETDAIEE